MAKPCTPEEIEGKKNALMKLLNKAGLLDDAIQKKIEGSLNAEQLNRLAYALMCAEEHEFKLDRRDVHSAFDNRYCEEALKFFRLFYKEVKDYSAEKKLTVLRCAIRFTVPMAASDIKEMTDNGLLQEEYFHYLLEYVKSNVIGRCAFIESMIVLKNAGIAIRDNIELLINCDDLTKNSYNYGLAWVAEQMSELNDRDLSISKYMPRILASRHVVDLWRRRKKRVGSYSLTVFELIQMKQDGLLSDRNIELFLSNPSIYETLKRLQEIGCLDDFHDALQKLQCSEKLVEALIGLSRKEYPQELVSQKYLNAVTARAVFKCCDLEYVEAIGYLIDNDVEITEANLALVAEYKNPKEVADCIVNLKKYWEMSDKVFSAICACRNPDEFQTAIEKLKPISVYFSEKDLVAIAAHPNPILLAEALVYLWNTRGISYVNPEELISHPYPFAVIDAQRLLHDESLSLDEKTRSVLANYREPASLSNILSDLGIDEPLKIKIMKSENPWKMTIILKLLPKEAQRTYESLDCFVSEGRFHSAYRFIRMFNTYYSTEEARRNNPVLNGTIFVRKAYDAYRELFFKTNLGKVTPDLVTAAAASNNIEIFIRVLNYVLRNYGEDQDVIEALIKCGDDCFRRIVNSNMLPCHFLRCEGKSYAREVFLEILKANNPWFCIEAIGQPEKLNLLNRENLVQLISSNNHHAANQFLKECYKNKIKLTQEDFDLALQCDDLENCLKLLESLKQYTLNTSEYKAIAFRSSPDEREDIDTTLFDLSRYKVATEPYVEFVMTHPDTNKANRAIEYLIEAGLKLEEYFPRLIGGNIPEGFSGREFKFKIPGLWIESKMSGSEMIKVFQQSPMYKQSDPVQVDSTDASLPSPSPSLGSRPRR